MRARTALVAFATAVLLLPGPIQAQGPRQQGLGLILRDNVAMRARPERSAPVLAVLIQQTQVAVLRNQGAWTRVRIWASVDGWVPSREIVFRKPWTTQSTYKAPVIHYRVRPFPPRPLNAAAEVLQASSLLSAPGGREVSQLPQGRVTVRGWQQDSTGTIWFHIGAGWVAAPNVRLLSPDPATVRTGGSYLWQKAAGKGMWLTLGPIAQTKPALIVKAAKAAGIKVLYLESAISPLGFHGKKSVGPLLDEAHGHGLTVIAWVYPYLNDIASDIELTRRVAAFRSREGTRFDGIAADLERNMTFAAVSTYSQLTRAYLGSRYLLVAVTYPPQSMPNYPFAEVGRTYNAIAPMDYWHQTNSPYGLDYGHMKYSREYARRYAADSVAWIRGASPGAHVAPIGQTFDNFGHEEMGPNAPSAGEIEGFFDGCAQSGAVGVSFFQWMTATVPEWRAIQRNRFGGSK